MLILFDQKKRGKKIYRKHRLIKFIGLSLIFILGLSACKTYVMIEANKAYQKLIENTGQIVVVVADDWKTTKASLICFDKKENNWDFKMKISPVQIGRAGMAWDPLIPETSGNKNLKKEGDGKSPAGVFKFGFAFGIENPENVLFTRMPYLLTNAMIECVDDVGSKHYNKVVSRDIIPDIDWKSSEHLMRADHLYEWGLVVEYNTKNVKAGAGSCIFFHIWRTPETPTAGCTAMSKSDIRELLGWLNPDKQPILVQMPSEVYEQIKGALHLPELQ